jgi:hypothetical protein
MVFITELKYGRPGARTHTHTRARTSVVCDKIFNLSFQESHIISSTDIN